MAGGLCCEGDGLSAAILVDRFGRALWEASYKWYNSRQHVLELGWTSGSGEGSACSVPPQIYSLSFLLQNSLHRSRGIPPGFPCCGFPHRALQLGGAGKPARWHRPPSPRRCHPQGRAWHAAGAKPGCLKPFSPAPSFLCNCLGSSVSENHNEGKFFNLNSQTDTHTQKKKNDLEKNPPNSFHLPRSEKWKERWPLPVLDNAATCDIFGGISGASTTFYSM